MQSMAYLNKWLSENANAERYLFTIHDLRGLFPELNSTAFKTLLSRSVKSGYLTRFCRGLYIFQKAAPSGLILFHAAAQLRSNKFNYISLETVLSDAGVISQIPMNWITIMTSGRSLLLACGEFGTIEFVHTKRKPQDLMEQLTYDENCKFWRASVPLALKDMKITHRNCDLINWDIANEFI